MISSERPQLDHATVETAINDFRTELNRRLNEKGYGSWLSRHEILGVLEEELLELKDAVHNKSFSDIRSELLDIAVGAVFGAACIDHGKMDW